MSTLQQMTDNTRTDLKIDPNGDIWDDAQLKRYINRFIGIVYDMLNVDFAEVEADLSIFLSTATYDLNTLPNYSRLESLRLDGRSQLLRKVDVNELENSGYDLTAQGEPTMFYFYGPDTVGLYPVPDGNIGTIKARYQRKEPTLTDSEEPAFAARWHYICELYAKAEAFDSVPGFEQQAQLAKQAFRRALQAMKQSIYERDNDGFTMNNTTTAIRTY